jgi:DNA-binding NtrC family response regulator
MGTRMSFFRDNSDSIRSMVALEEITEPQEKARILVVDDDPIFCRLMQRIGSIKGISVITVSNYAEAMQIENPQFDAAVMDYMLDEHATGLQVASRFSGDMYTMPVILVSHTSNIPGTKAWPATVREFIHKNFGPHAILDAAIEASDIAKLQRKIANRI